ncbi:MAG: YraN family protein [Phycisphaerales bacterium]|nr:YraN family protein [Phycisphaerales bacterium]
MRTGRRDKLGPRGERAAVRFLRRQGFRVLGRNLVTPFGEADIVCESPDRVVVVVEVKSRRSERPGPPPEAAVTQKKRQRLTRILEHLVRANGWHDRPRRIDVVAVEFRRRRWLGTKPALRHITDAVRHGGAAR